MNAWGKASVTLRGVSPEPDTFSLFPGVLPVRSDVIPIASVLKEKGLSRKRRAALDGFCSVAAIKEFLYQFGDRFFEAAPGYERGPGPQFAESELPGRSPRRSEPPTRLSSAQGQQGRGTSTTTARFVPSSQSQQKARLK